MVDQSADNGSHDAARALDVPLIHQIWQMTRAFWKSRLRGRLLLFGLAIFIVIIANAYVQTLLNNWNRPFYDALANRDLSGFLYQFGVFIAIAGTLLTLNVAQLWLNQMTKLRLREGLVKDLLDQWLAPGRAFRLAHASDLGVNPDQRIHEDSRRLTELTTDLGIGLMQSSILLSVFVVVLWEISSGFSFVINGAKWHVPGYLVWAAFLYTGLASALSWQVGKPLIPLNSDRYSREAELRFSLVRVNEYIDAITIQSGEGDEKARVSEDLNRVLTAMRRVVTVVTRLTWVQSGYGWLSMVAPIIIASPAYFTDGAMSFGGLMVAVGAFNQVQSSLRWFIDNFSNIADWRATLLRVSSFRQAVEETDELHGSGSRITWDRSGAPVLSLHDLKLASPTGTTKLREARVDITAGQRVLVVGDQGTGKTLLFRAIAGLWPWGEGAIRLPDRDTMMFLPRTPYIPPGKLKETLAYPNPPERYADADCVRSLQRLGLDRLADKLDLEARWDKDLGHDDRKALAFARMLLHRPAWIILDAALENLEPDMRERVARLFAEDLGASTIVHIGGYSEQDHLFDRLLHLEKVPEGALPVRPQPRGGSKQSIYVSIPTYAPRR